MDRQREALERLQDGYNELKSQLHNCPESLREQLQEQLKRVSLVMAVSFQDHQKLCPTPVIASQNLAHTNHITMGQ